MQPSLAFPRFLLVLAMVGFRATVAQGVPPGTQIGDVLYSTPSCARSCIVHELMEAHCPLLNITALADCLCPNFPLLSTLSTCVQNTCSHEDMIAYLVPSAMLCSLYPQESRASDIRTTCIATFIVGVLVTGFRCACRYSQSKTLGPEDWACVVALAMLLGMATNGLYLEKVGAGLHYWTEDPKNEVPLWTTFWAAQLLYVWCQFFTKLSLLLFYLRIFGAARWMKIACYGCIVALCTHSIPIFFLIFFQCQPLQAIWNKFIDGRCLDVTAIAYAGGALSIAWDVVLIVLPIPEIRKLQVSPRKRLSIIIIFALASLASVTTIIRLRFVVLFNSTHDPSWDNVDVGIWSIVEQLCIIVCGCLPVLRQWLVNCLPHVSVDWGTTKNATVRAGGPPNRHHGAAAQAIHSPRLPMPVRPWDTLGSLFVSTVRPTSFRLDKTKPQTTASWEELTDIMDSGDSEKAIVEQTTWDNRLGPDAGCHCGDRRSQKPVAGAQRISWNSSVDMAKEQKQAT